MWLVRFRMRYARPWARGTDALEGGAGADIALCHIQVVAIHVEVVFRIRGCRVHQLEKGLAGGLRGVLQNRQRLRPEACCG